MALGSAVPPLLAPTGEEEAPDLAILSPLVPADVASRLLAHRILAAAVGAGARSPATGLPSLPAPGGARSGCPPVIPQKS